MILNIIFSPNFSCIGTEWLTPSEHKELILEHFEMSKMAVMSWIKLQNQTWAYLPSQSMQKHDLNFLMQVFL